MASMAEYCLTAMSQWKSFDVLAYKEYTAHNSGTCTDPLSGLRQIITHQVSYHNIFCARLFILLIVF
jgi:hypothetical protein